MRHPKMIVVIMSDQHAAAATGCYGNSDVRTPVLDRLAKDSVIFTNTYCSAPICGPSRFAFLTGQHVHRCGAYDNGSTIPYDQPTIGHLMTNAGYRSVLCGRMHIHGPDQFVGFEERPAVGLINPIHSAPARMQPPDTPNLEFTGYSEGNNYDEFAVNNSTMLTLDDYVIDSAKKVINSCDGDERPLFLVIGLHTPHPVMKQRKEYRKTIEMYMELGLPSLIFTDEESQKEHPFIRKKSLLEGKGKLPDMLLNRKYQAEYFARITYVDRLIGDFLSFMQEEGLYDDSLIIYTSDHGETMGKKGIWGKVNFLDNASKVPLIIKAPNSSKSSFCDFNTSLVDIFPTLAELSGLKVPYELSGKSLLPGLDGKALKDDEAFCQYHGAYTSYSMYMLKQGKYKLNLYRGQGGELYNMDEDFEEKINLFNSGEYQSVLNRMTQRITEILGVDLSEIEQMVRVNQSRREFITNAVRNSVPTQVRMKENIKEFRELHDDPWWDDGEEISKYETQFTI